MLAKFVYTSFLFFNFAQQIDGRNIGNFETNLRYWFFRIHLFFFVEMERMTSFVLLIAAFFAVSAFAQASYPSPPQPCYISPVFSAGIAQTLLDENEGFYEVNEIVIYFDAEE